MEREELEQIMTAAEQCQGNEPALMSLVDQLDQRVRERESPELWYACAYVWYLHPRRLTDDGIWRRVDEFLRRVLQVLREDYLSLLYLGHNYYDRENYADAKVHFENARRVAPADYIGLKAYEMVVCCEIMASGLAGNSLQSLKVFVDQASQKSYMPEDIWPRELANALQRTTQACKLGSQQLDEAYQLADHLDQLGSLNGWIGSLVRSAQFG